MTVVYVIALCLEACYMYMYHFASALVLQVKNFSGSLRSVHYLFSYRKFLNQLTSHTWIEKG